MRQILLVLLLVSASLAAQAPLEPDPVVKLNDEAVALAAKGDNEAATKLLRKAIELRKIAGEAVEPRLEKNLVRVLLGWAADLADRQEWAEAETRLLEARRIDGDEALVYAWEGVVAYRRGLFNAALDRLEEALRRDPKLALAHEYQGLIHYKRENLDLALRELETAVAIEPERKARLEPFLVKLRGELEREGKMSVLRSTHFVCFCGRGAPGPLQGPVIPALLA